MRIYCLRSEGDAVRHDAAQRSRAGLEALLVGRDITVEVPLEHQIENGDFRMAGTINTRGSQTQALASGL
jgi:hypothetical protein